MKIQTQEMVFRLRMVSNGAQTNPSVWLESHDTQTSIRFDDVHALARYLGAMVHTELNRGLK
jgi:hypothetical protein